MCGILLDLIPLCRLKGYSISICHRVCHRVCLYCIVCHCGVSPCPCGVPAGSVLESNIFTHLPSSSLGLKRFQSSERKRQVHEVPCCSQQEKPHLHQIQKAANMASKMTHELCKATVFAFKKCYMCFSCAVGCSTQRRAPEFLF